MSKERLTMTTNNGEVASVFDLDITCAPSEVEKIFRLIERLNEYEELEKNSKKKTVR